MQGSWRKIQIKMDIQLVSIWKDGKVQKANEFIMRSVSDDLKSAATFYYELRVKETIVGDVVTPGQSLAEGNLTMDGVDYSSWDGSNTTVYQWALKQLNIKAA
jgi:hypothetical protein